MNKRTVFILSLLCCFLLIACFQAASAEELVETGKDFAGVAENNLEYYKQAIVCGSKILTLKKKRIPAYREKN